MAIHENKKYTLMVYNTVTHRNEEVEVTHDVYHAYRRTGWGIENNDTSFFAHEIQMSGLIGGEDGAYENFKEFIDTENIPDKTVVAAMELDALQIALSALTDADKALVQALFYDGLTEQEYAAQVGISQQMINRKKQRILKLLKKLLSEGL